MSMNQKDISNQVISMDKEYVTRDGRKVEILTVSRNHQNSIVFLVDNLLVHSCGQNGKMLHDSSLDLIEVTKIEEGLKKHDLVMVSDEGNTWYLRFFSHYEYGGVFAFNDGDYEGPTTHWARCRKATPQEIVAYKDSLKY